PAHGELRRRLSLEEPAATRRAPGSGGLPLRAPGTHHARRSLPRDGPERPDDDRPHHRRGLAGRTARRLAELLLRPHTRRSSPGDRPEHPRNDQRPALVPPGEGPETESHAMVAGVAAFGSGAAGLRGR